MLRRFPRPSFEGSSISHLPSSSSSSSSSSLTICSGNCFLSRCRFVRRSVHITSPGLRDTHSTSLTAVAQLLGKKSLARCHLEDTVNNTYAIASAIQHAMLLTRQDIYWKKGIFISNDETFQLIRWRYKIMKP